MSDPNNLSRRELFKGTVAAGAALGLASTQSENTASAKRSNAIIKENKRHEISFPFD